MVQCLVENGANMNKDSNWSPIYFAANNGHSKMVKYLAKQGADLDKKTDDGSTALIIAAKKGYLAIAQCLLENGAGVNETDTFSQSPLFIAIHDNGEFSRHYEQRDSRSVNMSMVLCLLDYRADTNDARSGCTPLYHAASKASWN